MLNKIPQEKRLRVILTILSIITITVLLPVFSTHLNLWQYTYRFLLLTLIPVVLFMTKEVFSAFFHLIHASNENLIRTQYKQQNKNTTASQSTQQQNVLLFKSIFRVCNVNTSEKHKAQFICKMFGINIPNDNYSNHNIYKFLTCKKDPTTNPEITSRINDYNYVAEQLRLLGLEKERHLILNEIEELKNNRP